LLVSHVIVWEFVVRAGHEREFEAVYGPTGAWATLFSKSPEHVGVELLRDTTTAGRYLTIDRWRSADAFGRFRKAHLDEYEALDSLCAGLTEVERKIGVCSVLSP
jgi:heme-degrading monooxygenase HmoA